MVRTDSNERLSLMDVVIIFQLSENIEIEQRRNNP